MPISIEIADPINKKILEVAEDRIQGFVVEPFAEIAKLTGLSEEVVIERIRAMLVGGTIRRVRQTLMAINLAPGALVAWQVPEEKLTQSFDWLFANDPFSGHVVIRSTDTATTGSNFRLWTTLKVPLGFSMTKHADYLLKQIGGISYHLMPAKKVFALGVGHVRRMGLEIGSKADVPAEAKDPHIVHMDELDWQVLVPLKREFTPEELTSDPWRARAKEAGVDFETFVRVSQSLNERGVIGRFSTFLEHVKPNATGERVTRFNALFHWAVPPGREIEAGSQVGRHTVMTHAYWREGGPKFNNVNIMGVAHGKDKDTVLAQKAAIDAHLKSCGIPLLYTNVFWGGRSEIKPSEISPQAYAEWCKHMGLDPESMRGPSPMGGA